MQTAKGKILVFTRAPIPGQTKTRLIPALGKEGAARLHAELIHRTLQKCTALGNVKTELWCAPDIHHQFFVSCADTYDVTLHKQSGNDLGQRMSNAFAESQIQSPWVILVGTDCPNLTINDLKQATTILDNGADAVLGPATDGGYVLIGLNRSAPGLFTDMPWGNDKIAELTRGRLRDMGMRWFELPVRNDIDRPDDLVHINFNFEDRTERGQAWIR
ncbi:MAG: TIGR04282 family arsenosugar biosynthesis glycosyltransferase [Acidiferrobacterales bacterium]